MEIFHWEKRGGEQRSDNVVTENNITIPKEPPTTGNNLVTNTYQLYTTHKYIVFPMEKFVTKVIGNVTVCSPGICVVCPKG